MVLWAWLKCSELHKGQKPHQCGSQLYPQHWTSASSPGGAPYTLMNKSDEKKECQEVSLDNVIVCQILRAKAPDL